MSDLGAQPQASAWSTGARPDGGPGDPDGREADRGGAVGLLDATPLRQAVVHAPAAVGDAVAGVAESGRVVPVALSALIEGLGQAYNRRPTKAAVMLAAGLGLSTASGLNTWLARRVFGAKQVTIGAERINPWLLAAWAATSGYALWDAGAGASAEGA